VNTAPPHTRRWPASVAVVAVIALQLRLPEQVVPPWWPALVAVEVLLLVPLVVANPLHLRYDPPWHRLLGAGLAAVLLAVNAARLVQLVLAVLGGDKATPGELIGGGALIWLTNVVATAIALWELDRGGPFARDPGMDREMARPDLMFPQMQGAPGWDANTWRPGFLDYFFVAFTAATAFSPTDTMPLSGRAKLVFILAASVSLLSIAVVAARAVNAL
jgi:hypothetical protein